VTLVAENDGDTRCQVLLITRKALQEIFKKLRDGEKYLKQLRRNFVKTGLAELLANNRLFRDRVLGQDVADWAAVADFLAGQGGPGEPFRAAARARLSTLPAPSPTDADKSRISSALNKVLADGAPPALNPVVFPEALRDEAGRLLARLGQGASGCEAFRLNRLLLAAVCPGIDPGPGRGRCSPTSSGRSPSDSPARSWNRSSARSP
jgi:hypothetical protein